MFAMSLEMTSTIMLPTFVSFEMEAVFIVMMASVVIVMMTHVTA